MEKIGAGGAGEVFAARHELTNRDAAIKLLLPDMSADQVMVRRFFHEAKSAASVQHPGVVTILDAGYTDEGRAYITMERLRGETLRQRLARQGTLPVEHAITLARQLASAVGATHRHGIVHRDLKPGNIFLVPNAEVRGGEQIKVVDFGLAGLAKPGGAMTSAAGSVLGTPAYMAPEQWLVATRVDHRADMYAIGCLMYECLCGEAPFGGGGPELLRAHLRTRPAPLRTHNTAVSESLEAVVLKLLEKLPSQRYQRCETLITALDESAAIDGVDRFLASASLIDDAPLDALDRDAHR